MTLTLVENRASSRLLSSYAKYGKNQTETMSQPLLMTSA
jgi:hypothetical protein